MLGKNTPHFDVCLLIIKRTHSVISGRKHTPETGYTSSWVGMLLSATKHKEDINHIIRLKFFLLKNKIHLPQLFQKV